MAKYKYEVLVQSAWVEQEIINAKSRRAAKKQLSDKNKSDKWKSAGIWKLSKVSD